MKKLIIILPIILFILSVSVFAMEPARWVEYYSEEDDTVYYYNAYKYIETGELKFYTSEELSSGAADKDDALSNDSILLNSYDDTIASGTCGDNLTWRIYNAGYDYFGADIYYLQISGYGDMYDYPDSSSVPWFGYRDVIQNILYYNENPGITSIGDHAFENFSAISNIRIPNTVKRIGDYSFANISNNSAYISDISCSQFSVSRGWDYLGDLEEIGDYAFYKTEILRQNSPYRVPKTTDATVYIPDSVRRIGEYAFYGIATEKCDYPVKIIFLSDIKEICAGSLDLFGGYGSAEGISVIFNGNSPSTVGAGVFGPANNLDVYYVDGKTGYESGKVGEYQILNSNEFSGKCGDEAYYCLNDHTLIIYGSGEMYDNIFPWRSLDGMLFDKLSIREGITYIGANAFYDCRNISGEIIIPDSVKKIGAYAFEYCGYNQNNGITVKFGQGLEEISSSAFCYSEIGGDIIIPDSVKYIGDHAFYAGTNYYSAGTLKLGDNVEYIGASAFRQVSLNGNLDLPDKLVFIGDLAFSGCRNFSGELVIPDSVTEIECSAFSGCSGFTSLKLPSDIKVIHSGVFKDCTGLRGKLTIPNGVTNIEYYAFYGCSGLDGNLSIPSKVESIEYKAFDGWTDLTSAVFYGNAPSSFGDVPVHIALYSDDIVNNNVFGDPQEVYDTFTIYYYGNKDGWSYPEWNDYRTDVLIALIIPIDDLNLSYRINQKTQNIYNISSISVSAFLSQFTNPKLVVLDKDDNMVPADGNIVSGYRICALDDDGVIVDYLTISVIGDIDGDGEAATPLDAMILARYLAEWDGYAGMVDENASDLDGDGVITLRDAVILVRFIAGWPEFTVLPYAP